ncbi:MAG: glycosyltransferase family 1 protein [bacterium]
MRILFDIRPLLSPQRSGIPLYALRLLRQLSRQGAHELALFCNSSRFPFPADVPPEGDRISHHLFRYPNRLLNQSFAWTGRPRIESLAGDFDLAYLPDLNYFPTNRPYVLTVHDLASLHHPEMFSLRHRLRQRQLNLKRALERAAGVIAASEHTREDLLERFDLDPKKISVVTPGVDAELYRPRTESELDPIRSRYRLPERFILFLATLEPRKNVDGLIRAFDRAETDDAWLILAGGRGWLDGRIFRTAKDAVKKDRIRFLGYIDEADKPALYAAAAGFAYPSHYEGFGMPALEALACGTPVIASSTTSLPEVVGDAGLLVNPEREAELSWAIGAVLHDRQLTDRLRRAGPLRARDFGWEESGRKLEKALTESLP